MARDWDAVSYVSRSKYREGIAVYLYDQGPAAPSEIADITGHALPHVSRALTQLRERDLVTLLVSEDQHHGRLYGLTQMGRAAVEHLRHDDLTAKMTVSGPDGFSKPGLLSLLRDELGDSLKRVERYTNDSAEVTFLDSSPQQDPVDEPVLLSELVLEWRERLPETAVHAFGNQRYMVGGFESMTALYLFPDDDSHYAISVDSAIDIPVRSLVEQCFKLL